MLSVNYDAINRLAMNKNKGYWRCKAKNILDKKIMKGNDTFGYLRGMKNFITIQKIDTQALNIKRIKYNIDDGNDVMTQRTPNKHRFLGNMFITSPINSPVNNYDQRIFQSIEEQNMFSQLSFLPLMIQNQRMSGMRRVYENMERIRNRAFSCNNKNKNHSTKNSIEKKKMVYMMNKKIQNSSSNMTSHNNSYFLSKSQSQRDGNKTIRPMTSDVKSKKTIIKIKIRPNI